jgi:hypothetical protein
MGILRVGGDKSTEVELIKLFELNLRRSFPSKMSATTTVNAVIAFKQIA